MTSDIVELIDKIYRELIGLYMIQSLQMILLMIITVKIRED